jgi:hypothetical protein
MNIPRPWTTDKPRTFNRNHQQGIKHGFIKHLPSLYRVELLFS